MTDIQEQILPFAPSGRLTCNASTDTLWDTPIEYEEGGLLSLRFLTICRKLKRCALVSKLRHSRFKAQRSSSPALDLAHRKMISLRSRLNGPRSTFFEQSVTMDRNQAQSIRLGGKKFSRRIWRSRVYDATATMVSDRKIISELKSVITVP